MSILTVSSQNPNLSHILSKNPATIRTEKKPFERELRKGRVYGWFSKPDNSEFRLLFLDSPTETSFGNRQEFEYLDTSRYSNPYLPIMMINTALNSAASKDHELDTEGFETSVNFTLQCRPGIINRFQEMAGMRVEVANVSSNHHNVIVTCSGVQKALNMVILICMVACLADEDTYVPLAEAGVTKYLNVLNRAKAPYYLRHLIISRAITNRNLFNKLNDLIQVDGMSFKFGNTQVQRLDAIRSVLNTGTRGETLFDLGCGEMHHTMKLMSDYTSVICFDADEDLVQKNAAKLAKKQIENVVVMHKEVDVPWVVDNTDLVAGNDVLLAEVLEHREKTVSLELLKTLLQTEANKIVLTVPCADFNEYYGILEGEFRHPDHKWEPRFNEWIEFVNSAVGDSESWDGYTSYVGDTVTTEKGTVGVSLITNLIRTGPSKLQA